MGMHLLLFTCLYFSDVTNTASAYTSSTSNLHSSHSKSVTSPSATIGRAKSATQSEPVDFSSNPPLSSLSAAAAARTSGFAADTCSTADNLARYRSSAASGT